MSEKTPMQRLWQDALSGKISRREVLTRGAALGLSAPVLAALAQETIRGTLAAEEGAPSTTFYSWMLDLHPGMATLGEEMGVNVETAPTENFGFDRFIAESNEGTSTWDSYGGVTPFLEMIALVDTGTIEPWDPYLPEGLLDDFVPATREEGTYDGQFYVWPLLLDVCVQGWNADLVEQAGLDPEAAPADWDEFIAAAQAVKDSGVAPYGLTFDNRDWRSLIPVTHSISTDVYSPEGLFLYNSEPAVQALEIMKRLMPLANGDVLAAAGVDNTVLVDEAAFAAGQAAYYFKYQNAHLRNAAQWPDPEKLRLAALPVSPGGVGGTVFWDTGAVLFKNGFNKQEAVDFFLAIANDDRIWENSIVGNAEEGILPAGQIPVLQSKWTEWEANPPEWLTANPWARAIVDGLENAKAIAPSILAIRQFDIARPEWHKYLSGETATAEEAGQAAMDAVIAEYQAQTGEDPQIG